LLTGLVRRMRTGRQVLITREVSPGRHRHVGAELGGVPEQIAVSSAFRRWNSNSRMSQNRLCSAPPQLRQRRRAGGCWSTEMSERVVRRAVSASLSAVRGEYRSADRRGTVADQECDQAGDRLRRDRVRHRLFRERGPVGGGCRAAGARPRSPGSRAGGAQRRGCVSGGRERPCSRCRRPYRWMARSPGGRLRARWHLSPATECAALPPGSATARVPG